MTLPEHFQKFTKYGTVAFGAALTDWAVFSTLIFEQIISRIVGGLFSFAANGHWSFNTGGNLRIVRAGRRFLLLYLFSYCLSILLFYIFLNVLETPIFVSKLSTDGMILVINYLVMNSYVFHRRDGILSLLRMNRSRTHGNPVDSLEAKD